MPPPGFRRSLPLLDLSPAESTQIRIKPKRELTNYEIALGAAKAGALGGPVAGNLGRSMISYEDWLGDINNRELVFRGLKARPGGGHYNPLLTSGGNFSTAYGATNPAVAATFAGTGPDERARMAERLLREAGGLTENTDSDVHRAARGLATDAASRRSGRGVQQAGTVSPLWVSTRNTVDFPWRDLPNMDAETAMFSREWDRATLDDAGPGVVTVAEDVIDEGGDLFFDTGAARGQSSRPHRQFSWGQDAAVELAGEALSVEESGQLIRDAASRLGLDPSKPVPEGLQKDVIEEISNDPRYRVSRGAKLGKLLKGMAREAVRPKNILLDALIGSGVGAGSALAGYATGQPRSAGVFDLPGEYQQALTNEDLMAQIESRTATKEALRQKYVDEVNDRHGPGTLQPGARIEEIRDYLGPVRGLQGR